MMPDVPPVLSTDQSYKGRDDTKIRRGPKQPYTHVVVADAGGVLGGVAAGVVTGGVAITGGVTVGVVTGGVTTGGGTVVAAGTDAVRAAASVAMLPVIAVIFAIAFVIAAAVAGSGCVTVASALVSASISAWTAVCSAAKPVASDVTILLRSSACVISISVFWMMRSSFWSITSSRARTSGAGGKW